MTFARLLPVVLRSNFSGTWLPRRGLVTAALHASLSPASVPSVPHASAQQRSPALLLATGALCLTSLALLPSILEPRSGGVARLEDGESRPPWETRPAAPLRWTALVRALAVAQSAGGFSAHRRLLPFPLDGSGSAEGEEELLWEYRLEFPASPETDMLDLFSSLLHGFSSGEANVSSQELATRTVLCAEQKDFEVRVTVPRHEKVDRSVMLTILRAEPDAPFSATEVAVVKRAFDLSQHGQDTSLAHQDVTGGVMRKGKLPVAPASPRGVAALRFPKGVDDGRDEDYVQSAVSFAELDEDRVATAKEKLESFGAQVYIPDDTLTWAALAGYDEEKEAMQESIVLPLKHPELYEGIARETRERYESLLPRAVLLEGLPGCGKTTAAKVIAAEIGRPFVVLNVESFLSKYYGETTTKLAEILEATREMGPCVLFCDEVDSLGSGRDDPQAHEVTRRVLSVLLRFLDGIDGPSGCVMVAATNVKHLLDEALLSRFDVQICMGLPDAATRAAILGRYARQLTAEERDLLGKESAGFSGRALHDACKTAERACAGRAIRESMSGKVGSPPEIHLPSLQDYLNSIRLKAQSSIGSTRNERRAD